MEELVRGIAAALNARDFEALEAFPLDPDFEFRSLISDSEGSVYRGFDGLRAWAADIDDIFEEFRFEILEVRPAGEEAAVVMLRIHGRAKTSGAPFDERNAQVWLWRNGRLWRNEAYSNPTDALRAAGID